MHVKQTPFSAFFTSATTEEKRKVYIGVIDKSINQQKTQTIKQPSSNATVTDKGTLSPDLDV